MREADRVHVDANARIPSGKLSRRPSVIQMYVGDEDSTRRLVQGVQRVQQNRKARARTGVDQPSVHQMGGNYLPEPQVFEIDGRYR